MKEAITLNSRIHNKYLKRYLTLLPKCLNSFDTTRVTLVYFAISGLDVLNAINTISDVEKQRIINWIYSLQILDETEHVSGFQGSSTFNTKANKNSAAPYKWSHIASTYCALTSLVILGDNLSRVNRTAVVNSLRRLQLSSGCFKGAIKGTESDMRFLFCAASICYILDDWTGMDIEKAKTFIIKSISYDNGIAQEPELESHGGSTYCALATLALSGQVHVLSKAQIEGLKRWLFWRQQDGFNGRPNKPVDTCYAFWIGASLKILDAYDLLDCESLKAYVLATQDNILGGFSKWVSSYPDVLHTYLGLAGLSLMEHPGLNEVVPMLNITYRSNDLLRSIHKSWQGNKETA